MKDQIVMSKINGNVAVAIPLFRNIYDDTLDRVANYLIAFSNKPVAYAIDCGPEIGIQLMNAEFAENNLIFLGDL